MATRWRVKRKEEGSYALSLLSLSIPSAFYIVIFLLISSTFLLPNLFFVFILISASFAPTVNCYLNKGR